MKSQKTIIKKFIALPLSFAARRKEKITTQKIQSTKKICCKGCSKHVFILVFTNKADSMLFVSYSQKKNKSLLKSSIKADSMLFVSFIEDFNGKEGFAKSMRSF